MDQSKQRQVATWLASSGSDEQRRAVLAWMVGLLQIRDSTLTTVQKGKAALRFTAKSKVVLPAAKLLAQELKRLGWNERGTKGRAFVVGAGAGLALFGGQGAGIAALGGAIGVPLWVVLGGGAVLAVHAVDALRASLPNDKQHPSGGDVADIIAAEAKIKE